VQQLRRPTPTTRAETVALPDLADVRGQESAKRALEVAAAGAHNMIMIGPPGAGKSMLAQRLPSLLPALSARELLEVSMIQSVAGELPEGALTDRRPFRAPHHSASMASLVGGGLRARPGEASLAHNGVLFLDELPEFMPNVIDALRQPLENGEVTVTRANYRVTFPARFQLVAAMNPCRCGRHGEPGFACRRGRSCDTEYQARISGPFLDRMDIMIEVPAVRASDLMSGVRGESSSVVAARVERARQRQSERYAAMGLDFRVNGLAPHAVIEQAAKPDASGLALLSDAAARFGLSARGLTRTLRVARTLADLDDVATVSRIHLAEALAYRFLVDRKPLAA
jgi:magnesium chelatase family protein